LNKVYYSEDFTKKAEDLIHTSKDCLTRKTAQAYYFVNALKMTQEEAAKAIGCSPRTVGRYRKKFHEAMENGTEIKDPRGGRFRSLVSLEEEEKFVNNMIDESKKGVISTMEIVAQKFNKTFEKSMCESGVYRMLRRHGWRKVKPRPRNPKASQEEQDTFKKNCQT